MNKSIIANGVLGLGIIGSGIFGYTEYQENKEVHAKNEKLNENLIQDTKEINQLNIINETHEKSIVGYKQQLEKFKINTEKKERKIKKLNKSLNESQEELHKLKMEVNRIEALRQAELAESKVEKVSQQVIAKSTKNDTKKSVTTTTSKETTQSTSGSYNQTFQASFYTAHAASTGKSAGDVDYGVTASGTKVQLGRTLACPPSYPFGTKIELEGYGVRVCEDRGGAIQGNNRIDIYVSTESEAYSLGRKSIRGRVLN